MRICWNYAYKCGAVWIAWSVLLESPSMHQPAHRVRLDSAMDILHLLMAGYFAVLLPFICWGALGTPGHPHSRPHFVFAPPPQAAAPLPQHLMLADGSCHIAAEGGHMAGHGGHTAAGGGVPVGRSVPVLAIGTVLLPVKLLAAAVRSAPSGPAMSILVSAPAAKAAALAPATPPPETTCSSHATLAA